VTEELCKRDAYARIADAIVDAVVPEGIVLDRTVFYARGGGQPGDIGWLRWEGGEVWVTDTVRLEGTPVHVIQREAPTRGTLVTAEIDWGRRYLNMRTHSALHILSGVVWTNFGAKVTGGNMDPPVARMDFELDSMSAEFGRDVEALINIAVEADRPVHVRFLPRREALADPELIRTKINLIPEDVDPIRVIDIEGIDRQADGGTHVRSTAEVGPIRVLKTESKGKAFKRMRIELQR
jgi:misacylated tRNA(Ala) deacylase